MGESDRAVWQAWTEKKRRLASLVYEQTAQKLPTIWLRLSDGLYWPFEGHEETYPEAFEDLLRHWPESPTDRLDRILLTISRESSTPGLPSHVKVPEPLDERMFVKLFASVQEEAIHYLNALQERGLICIPSMEKSDIFVTADGWDHLYVLQETSRSPESPAFVAMWFGDDNHSSDKTAAMTHLYRHFMLEPIERAGYKADRSDLVPHNDFVMNKVLAMIRQAPFVVADFTGNRGGVYFEAGFARGLGIPVIHTCRKDSFDVAHFDIRQINTVVWTKPEQLSEGIFWQVTGNLGPGPFKQATRLASRISR